MNFPFLQQRLTEGDKPCSLCGGVGVIVVQSTLQSTVCVCEYLRREQRAYEALSCKVAGLSPRLEKTGGQKWDTLANFYNAVLDLTQQFWDHKWLMVSGERGCGKTHVLYNAYLLIRHSAVYVSAVHLKSTIFDSLDSETLGHYKQALIDAPVLFIDDVGSENGTPFIKGVISDIIMERYALGTHRPTVISTNDLAILSDLHYQRIRSRLLDTALVGNYHITLGDYRIQRKAAS